MIKHLLHVVCHYIHVIMLCPSANTLFILTYLIQSHVSDTHAECAQLETCQDLLLLQLLQTSHQHSILKLWDLRFAWWWEFILWKIWGSHSKDCEDYCPSTCDAM